MSKHLDAILIFICGLFMLPAGTMVSAAPSDPKAAKPATLPRGVVRLGRANLRFEKGVSGVEFLGKSKQFAANNGNFVRIFDLSTFREVRNWQVNRFPIHALAATADGRMLSTDGSKVLGNRSRSTIRLWDVRTGKLLREIVCPRGPIYSLKFSPDGRYLASFGWEREPFDTLPVSRPDDTGVRVWEVATGKEVPAFRGGLPGARAPRFTPDSKTLIWQNFHATTQKNRKVYSRSLKGGKDRVAELKDNPAWAAPFAHYQLGGYQQGKLLPSVLFAWTEKDQKQPHRLPVPRSRGRRIEFVHVSFSPDRSLIATGGERGIITLWDVKQGTSRILGRHTGNLSDLEFSPDGKTLLSCGYDRAIRVWDVATGKQRQAQGHSEKVLDVAVSPDAQTVATASHDGTLRLWNRQTGKELHVLSGHNDPVTATVFLNPRHLISVGQDCTIRLWDTRTGKQLKRIYVRGQGLHSLALSPDGKQLATGDGDGTILLWSTTTWQVVKEAKGHHGRIAALTFDPDGKFLFSGNDTSRLALGLRSVRDNTFRMWNVRTGKEIRQFGNSPDWPPQWLTVSSDGKLALSSEKEKGTERLTVWETTTGKARVKLPRLIGGVSALAFSPDGKDLFLSLSDYTGKSEVQVWDVTTWKVKQTLKGHRGRVNAITFSRNAQWMVTASDDSSAMVWDLKQVLK